MIQLVDGMLVINLEALAIALRANLFHIGLWVLLVYLYLSYGAKK